MLYIMDDKAVFNLIIIKVHIPKQGKQLIITQCSGSELHDINGIIIWRLYNFLYLVFTF